MRLLVYNTHRDGVNGVFFECFPVRTELLDYLPDYFPRFIPNHRVYDGFIPFTSIPDYDKHETSYLAYIVFYAFCNAEVDMVQSASATY